MHNYIYILNKNHKFLLLNRTNPSFLPNIRVRKFSTSKSTLNALFSDKDTKYSFVSKNQCLWFVNPIKHPEEIKKELESTIKNIAQTYSKNGLYLVDILLVSIGTVEEKEDKNGILYKLSTWRKKENKTYLDDKEKIRDLLDVRVTLKNSKKIEVRNSLAIVKNIKTTAIKLNQLLEDYDSLEVITPEAEKKDILVTDLKEFTEEQFKKLKMTHYVEVKKQLLNIATIKLFTEPETKGVKKTFIGFSDEERASVTQHLINTVKAKKNKEKTLETSKDTLLKTSLEANTANIEAKTSANNAEASTNIEAETSNIEEAEESQEDFIKGLFDSENNIKNNE